MNVPSYDTYSRYAKYALGVFALLFVIAAITKIRMLFIVLELLALFGAMIFGIIVVMDLCDLNKKSKLSEGKDIPEDKIPDVKVPVDLSEDNEGSVILSRKK